jgi:capsular exopolysaccharide synthesis family protein
LKRVSFISGFAPSEDVEASYRALCSNLMTGNISRKVFLLTGHSQGEGTSMAAIRLAAVCAGMGNKVLLLDADMRRSVLKTRLAVFGQALPGLSEYLQDASSIEEAVYSTDISGLYLMPPGGLPKNPSELLASERFRELIEIVRRVFDFVFIDTTPIGHCADATTAAVRADSAILVVESGGTRGRDAKRDLLQLGRSHCPVEGALLMKSKGAG